MKKIFILLLLALVFSATDFSQTAPSESDFQVWNETVLTVHLIKSKDKKIDRFSLVFYGLLRASAHLEAFNDERVGFGLEFKPTKFLTLTPSYIYRRGLSPTDKREYESRLRFDIGLEKKFKNFSIKNRARIEERFRNSTKDSTRFRNKFQFNLPIHKDKKEIFAPFVATEPYYEFQTKHWTRNEFSVGIGKKFTPHFSAEFFYMLQNNRGNFYRYVNIVGANLKFSVN